MDFANSTNKTSTNTMNYNNNNNNTHIKYTRKRPNYGDRANNSRRQSQKSTYAENMNNKNASINDKTFTEGVKKQFHRSLNNNKRENEGAINNKKNDMNYNQINRNNYVNNNEHNTTTTNINQREIVENMLKDVETGALVEIKTKRGEVINGIMHCCNSVSNPPLCLIYQCSLPGYKNLHVVAWNQIVECRKIKNNNVNCDIELKQYDTEAVERRLQKHMEERKNKMLTLNLNVPPDIQDLFDYLYKTMPQGQCEWQENDIVLNNYVHIKKPYKSLSSEYEGNQTSEIKYITDQLAQFWSRSSYKYDNTDTSNLLVNDNKLFQFVNYIIMHQQVFHQ